MSKLGKEVTTSISVENMDDAFIKKDRMRFTKNKLSSGLALLALVLDVFYFISLYSSDVGHAERGGYYYNIRIAVSLIYNLLFLLIVFLCSEGVKNYVRSYHYVLIVMGLFQFVRIFILPWQALHFQVTLEDGGTVMAMDNAQFIRVCIYLGVSGLCCVIAAIAGLSKCKTLENHQKAIEQLAGQA